MAQLQLRPFSVGEIIDAAFTVYKERFKQLITISAVVVIPLGILQALLAGSLDTTDPDGALRVLPAIGALTILGAIVSQIATAAITRAVADAYLGIDSDWQSSFRAALSRFGTIIVAAILFGLGTFGGLILLIVPGVIIYVSWVVYMPALMVEDLGATDSLRRSWSLVSGRRWPVFGTILLISIIAAIVGGVIGVVVGLVVTTTAGSTAAALLSVVGSVITTPFVAAATVVIYFDLRVRKEAFDIELLASQRPAADGIARPPGSDTNPPPEASSGGDPTWPPPVDG